MAVGVLLATQISTALVVFLGTCLGASATTTKTVPTYTYTQRSIHPGACPSLPTPTTHLAPFSQQIKGSNYTLFAPRNGKVTSDVMLAGANNSFAVYDFSNSSRLQYTLDTGQRARIDDSGIYLYTPNCKTEVFIKVPRLFKKAKAYAGATVSRRQLGSIQSQHVPLEPRAATEIDVTVSLFDQCGTPLKNVDSSLLCYQLAAAEEKFALTGDGTGVYTGQCEYPDTTALESTCEATTKEILNYITGGALGAITDAGNFNNFIKRVAGKSVLSKVAPAVAGVLEIGVIASCIEVLGAFDLAVYALGGVDNIAHTFCSRKYNAFKLFVRGDFDGTERTIALLSAPPSAPLSQTFTLSQSTVTCTSTTTSTLPEPTGKNFLPDPSFELSQWTLSHGATYGTEYGAYTGNTYLRLQGNGTAQQSISTVIYPGWKFKMTLAIRPWHLTKDCTLMMYVYGDKLNNYTILSVNAAASGSSTDWFYETANVGRWDSAAQPFRAEITLEYGNIITGRSAKQPCIIDVDEVGLIAV